MKTATLCSFDSRKYAEFSKAFRKGRRAMMEYVDDATFVIKKQPLKAVGIAFGAALAIGIFAGRKI